MNEVYFNYLSEIVQNIDPLFRISLLNKSEEEIEKEIEDKEKKIKQIVKDKQLFLGNGVDTYYVTISSSQYGYFNKNRCVMKRWAGETIQPNLVISQIAGVPEAARYLGISAQELEEKMKKGIRYKTKRIITPNRRKNLPVFSLEELNKYKMKRKIA